MKRKNRSGARGFWRGVRGGSLAVVILALVGCEGSGGGDPWADHDFGPNNRNVCLALGDSITAGSALDNYSQCYIPKLAGMLQKTIVNEAIPGSETGVGVDRVHPLLDDTQPGFLLILYGINDLIMGYDEATAVNNLRTMIRAAKDNKTVPIIATLTPVMGGYVSLVSSVQRMNGDIRQMAAEEDVRVADLENAMDWDPAYMLPDGLHPNEPGNDVMAATFYDVLN